jgi:hypothetical protein
MKTVANLVEWNRRILATRLAPVPPATVQESPFRDRHAIRWTKVNGSWVLDFADAGTRGELLRRLPGAVIAHSGLRYAGRWGAFTTQNHTEWAEAAVSLYEAYDLGFL